MTKQRKTDVPVDDLRAMVRYEPETGKLFWRQRPREMFPAGNADQWNGRFAGKEAFTYISKSGYKSGAIFSRLYYAHRVAWAIQTGKWPDRDIDHINGKKDDNSFKNLRPATRSQNNMNSRVRTGTSKFKGVFWDSNLSKWRAHARIDGKVKYLGCFENEADAARAYDAAAIDNYGHFARLNFKTP